ncbi:MAG TPA: type II secretion system F family protein [Noviherbaspirillum sp.]|nr:type II secretion system F family protein [Noviherbaspirillum sp.]HJW55777.1 type II secretion system F family protein [Burkholderiaceae bacterium]
MQTDFRLIPTLVALALGVSFAAFTWIASRALSDVPEEDRMYLDPPPVGFRLVWWPIRWLTFYFGGLLSARYKQRLHLKLRRAGLEFCLSPEQFFASRIICAAIATLVALWMTTTFNFRPWVGMFCLALLGFSYPGIWLADRLAFRRRDLLKSLPFFLDIITLCVEAGLNLQGAMNQAVLRGPKGVMRDEIQKVLRDARAGKQRAEAMRAMAERLGEAAITNLVTSLIQAESVGMNLGPVLRAQAEQRRSERFLRAEKLAMEAPVKMLLPLIAFIFPCTFIVLGFPIVMKLMTIGL